jgi:hypothetical protein
MLVVMACTEYRTKTSGEELMRIVANWLVGRNRTVWYASRKCGPRTGSFKDATATINIFAKSQNQNYDITKNVSLLII